MGAVAGAPYRMLTVHDAAIRAGTRSDELGDWRYAARTMQPWIRTLSGAIAVAATGTAWSQTMLDKLQPEAVKVAQVRGTAELGCPAAESRVLKRELVEEGATTGWSDIPRQAEYTVAVSGCGKQKTYLVTCDRWEKGCSAGEPRSAEVLPPRLADELQPAATQAAQRRGVAELECPAASAAVLRKETLEEGQTTGWYDPPRQAVFRIDVSGCGKSRPYLVSCDSRKKGDTACVAVAFQQAPKHSVSRLADELQPAALAAAQRRAASEFACPAAEASVLRKETLDEGAPTTGWYEPPRRAVYRMDVTGCGKHSTYLVACDRLRKGEDMCKVGGLAQAAP